MITLLWNSTDTMLLQCSNVVRKLIIVSNQSRFLKFLLTNTYLKHCFFAYLRYDHGFGGICSNARLITKLWVYLILRILTKIKLELPWFAFNNNLFIKHVIICTNRKIRSIAYIIMLWKIFWCLQMNIFET